MKQKASVEIIKNNKPLVIARDSFISPRLMKIAEACAFRNIPFGLGYSNDYDAGIVWEHPAYNRFFT
jgi:hypothetical protein